jgi:hypothetical protein
MDDLSRAFYELKWKVTYIEAKGAAFQDLFSTVMEKCHPGDFQRVRPWGRQGDRKNDGYLASQKTLFAVYAPNEVEAAETVRKLNSDFKGALPYWEKYFKTWVFVHNSMIGLGPEVLQAILDLKSGHAVLGIGTWGFEELRQEVFTLKEADLASLLGPVPSRYDMQNVGMVDLEPLLDHVGRLRPMSEEHIHPVPPGKLEENSLSDAVATLLQAGFARSKVVADYFRRIRNPKLRDEVAEVFRAEYVRLREEGMPPDDIFHQLQVFVGGSNPGPPIRQAAILAVLAYFFEECEIFERPVERSVQ